MFISADKLQVTALKGVLGEEIDLVVRVQAFPKASKWLRTLENVMKNTLAMILQACVQTRVEEGKKKYCRIIFLHGGQCSWVAKFRLVHRFVILLVESSG